MPGPVFPKWTSLAGTLGLQVFLFSLTVPITLGTHRPIPHACWPISPSWHFYLAASRVSLLNLIWAATHASKISFNFSLNCGNLNTFGPWHMSRWIQYSLMTIISAWTWRWHWAFHDIALPLDSRVNITMKGAFILQDSCCNRLWAIIAILFDILGQSLSIIHLDNSWLLVLTNVFKNCI